VQSRVKVKYCNYAKYIIYFELTAENGGEKQQVRRMKVPAKILKLLPRDKETHSLEKKMVKKRNRREEGRYPNAARETEIKFN